MSTTTPYEAPAIRRLISGSTNKFGCKPARERVVRSSIAGVAVARLVADHGSPLFVYDERIIRERVRLVRDTFRARWPDTTLAWSYKTCPLAAICAIMHDEGSLAEVVSATEYEKARSHGVAGRDILFNGPWKPLPALRRAVADGAHIHIDHEGELDDVLGIANERGRTLEVGIRIHLDAGIQPRWTRFGFGLESGDAWRAAERLAQSGRVTITSLHAHLGTYILDPEAYARQTALLIAFCDELSERLGITIRRLDLGGGLPSRSRLKGTWQSAEATVPTIEEYADAIGNELRRRWPDGDGPQLVLEPGRALVDEAGTLITSVVGHKKLPDGSPGYVMDAGVNLLYTATWYAFDVAVTRDLPGPRVPSVLYGPLCMNIDVIHERADLPRLPRGTPLLVSPVGAYNVNQSMQFIHLRPAVVLIGEDGSVDVIRVAEGLDDWTHCERLPSRLQPSAPAPAMTQ
jgi:diaminopimelate decarboxylase